MANFLNKIHRCKPVIKVGAESLKHLGVQVFTQGLEDEECKVVVQCLKLLQDYECKVE